MILTNLLLTILLLLSPSDSIGPDTIADYETWRAWWLEPSPSHVEGWASRYGDEGVMEATLAFNGLALQPHHIGAIAMKSPNDLGRVYCLHGVGSVLVGDVAALHDWAPVGESVLGPNRLALVWVDGYPWVADLPNGLYYAAGGEGGPVIVRLTEGRC